MKFGVAGRQSGAAPGIMRVKRLADWSLFALFHFFRID
jgi:hypothetical protein